MSVRFALNVITMVAAVFVVVVSMAFSPTPAGWIAFGVSTGITVVAVVGLVLAKSLTDRGGQVAIATIGLWSLIAALVFSGNVLTWLVFADAIGVAGASLAQLVANEVESHRALRAAQEAAATQSSGRVGLAA